MLSFSLLGQLLFNADMRRYCGRPRPQRAPDEECCSICYQNAADWGEFCSTAVLQVTRGRVRGEECKVFDFKLCTRLEIYKQKRSNPSCLFQLLNTVSAAFCFNFNIQTICTLNFTVWHAAPGAPFQKAIRSVILYVIKFIVLPE